MLSDFRFVFLEVELLHDGHPLSQVGQSLPLVLAELLLFLLRVPDLLLQLGGLVVVPLLRLLLLVDLLDLLQGSLRLKFLRRLDLAAPQQDLLSADPQPEVPVLRKGQIGQNNEKAYQIRSTFSSQCGLNTDQY